MASKAKQRYIFLNPVLDRARVTSGDGCTPASAVSAEHLSRQVRRERFKLTDFAVTVTAALDYGSRKLCDLPAGNLIVSGAIVDLSAVGSGGFSAEENLDLALGTAATASTDFSGAGEDNIVEKIDGTAGGVVDGASNNTTKHLFVAAGANAVYVNVATGNIATDGAVTLNGYIDLFYLDMGKAS